ncbi:SE-cephalotoxin-like [Mytilus trossulus]|uniref:SE-cephalotoxin-like n=1 Tax=Mytilus trossulus TaxID=6551 RepID=UPI0030053FDB
MFNILVGLTSKWSFMVILLLMVLSLDSSRCQDDEEVVSAGLELGKEITELLGKKEFTTTLSRIAKNIGPFLGALGPFVGFVLAFFPSESIESEELAYMKNMMKIIDQRLDNIDNRFNDIERLIQWNVVQVNFGQLEQRIRAVSLEFEYIYDVPEPAVQNRKELFISSYDNDYQNSGNKLYQAIVQRQGVFQEDLGTSVLRYTGYDRKMTQLFLLGVMQLLLQAVKVELGYLLVNQYNHNADYMKLKWEQRIKEVSNKFEQIDDQCVQNYHKYSGKDIDDFSSKNNGIDRNFSDKLYELLQKKYYWRTWIVVSMDPIGGDKFWVEVSGGHIRFKKNGRNIAVASYDENNQILDYKRAIRDMKNVQLTTRVGSWWTGYKNVPRPARNIGRDLYKTSASLVMVVSCYSYYSVNFVYQYRNWRGKVDRCPYYDFLMWGRME